MTYFRDEDESHNGQSPKEQTEAEHRGKDVEIFPECVGAHHCHCPEQAGDISGSRNVEGVVQSLHLHLACGEGQEESDDLQHTLVAVQHPQEDGAHPGVAEQDVVILQNPKHLRNIRLHYW